TRASEAGSPGGACGDRIRPRVIQRLLNYPQCSRVFAREFSLNGAGAFRKVVSAKEVRQLSIRCFCVYVFSARRRSEVESSVAHYPWKYRGLHLTPTHQGASADGRQCDPILDAKPVGSTGLRFWAHAKVYDRRPAGTPTGEADVCKAALRPVLR